MVILDEFKDAIQVLKMNHAKIVEIANKKEATFFGVMILAVPPVINVILNWWIFPPGSSIFSSFVIWTVAVPYLSYVITIFLMSLLAEKVFHGGKHHLGFFRIMAYAGIVLWVTMLPFLLARLGLMADPARLFKIIYWLGGAWMLYVSFYVLMLHHRLAKDNAVVTVVLAVIIAMIVNSILGNMLVGSIYRLY